VSIAASSIASWSGGRDDDVVRVIDKIWREEM
jgi:hypothetical protein